MKKLIFNLPGANPVEIKPIDPSVFNSDKEINDTIKEIKGYVTFENEAAKKLMKDAVVSGNIEKFLLEFKNGDILQGRLRAEYMDDDNFYIHLERPLEDEV